MRLSFNSGLCFVLDRWDTHVFGIKKRNLAFVLDIWDNCPFELSTQAAKILPICFFLLTLVFCRHHVDMEKKVRRGLLLWKYVSQLKEWNGTNDQTLFACKKQTLLLIFWIPPPPIPQSICAYLEKGQTKIHVMIYQNSAKKIYWSLLPFVFSFSFLRQCLSVTGLQTQQQSIFGFQRQQQFTFGFLRQQQQQQSVFGFLRQQQSRFVFQRQQWSIFSFQRHRISVSEN